MRIEAGPLQKVAATIIEAAGSSAEEADQVAMRLVEANLTGHDSHGVIRVPQYVDAVKKGAVVPNQRAALLSETEVAGVLDGQFGYGQVVGAQAVEAAIARAKRHGVGLAALRNSGHLGRIGDWAELAAAAGMTSLHFVNVVGVPLRGVPHGGRDPRGTTNPIAIGMPVDGAPPIVLDFATTAVAEGKVRVARNKGVALPEGCLIDAEGRPTTDAGALYADPPASLLPLGGAVSGHKGGGLWLLCDLLAGALTGGGSSRMPGDGERFSSNMLSIVIAPGTFGEASGVTGEVRRYIDFVKSSRPRQPGGEVLLPGEPEQRSRTERLASGIPIDPTTWKHIVAGAESVGVERARLEAMAGAAAGTA
jgi:hydroxycarboxylate dehydrogenase B